MPPYIKTNWVSGSVPSVNAANLNKIEQGIKDALPKDGSEVMLAPITFSGNGRVASPGGHAEVDAKEACYFGSNCYYDTGVWKRHDTSKVACLMEVNYASAAKIMIYVASAGANPINWTNSGKVWTELNDGAGSGLDADFVRGYVPVNKGGDTMFGSILFDNGQGVAVRMPNGDAKNAIYMNSANQVVAGDLGLAFYIRHNGILMGYDGTTYTDLWRTDQLRVNAGVLEFYTSGAWRAAGGMKKVQRGVSSGGDVTVTAVNMDKSFLTFTNLSKPQNGDMFGSAYLINSTTVRVTASNTTGSLSWELVEFY